MTFNATYKPTPPLDVAQATFADWEAVYEEHAAGTGGRQFALMYNFMVLRQELLLACAQGILTSLGVAFGALCLVTFNWAIAALGLLNITIILILFLGIMPLMGWQLGVYESIFLIMTVGLSVDYTVHLLHAYNHSVGATREEKPRDAMSAMGITVLSGAITTLP